MYYIIGEAADAPEAGGDDEEYDEEEPGPPGAPKKRKKFRVHHDDPEPVEDPLPPIPDKLPDFPDHDDDAYLKVAEYFAITLQKKDGDACDVETEKGVAKFLRFWDLTLRIENDEGKRKENRDKQVRARKVKDDSPIGLSKHTMALLKMEYENLTTAITPPVKAKESVNHFT